MTTRKSVDFAVYESVRLPIYYRPVKVKLKGPTRLEGANGDSLSASEAGFKIYDSFQIAFYESGRWRSVRAPTLAKAKAKGRLIAKRLAVIGSEVSELSHADRRIYVAAKKILQPHNLEVDGAARLVAELLERLDGVSLQQAVDFFNTHGRRIIPGATRRQVYTAYLDHLDGAVWATIIFGISSDSSADLWTPFRSR